ncbi:MAG: flavin reductase [Clostridiales bacterium]|nr:flavin reductase [Clostridiales bacterium]
MDGKSLTVKDRTAILSNLDSSGIFVTCGRQNPNIMVTHWGTLGKLWGRDVFTLPIRSNKYSYQIVTKTKSFALNVPARDMRREISLCDTISGFNRNKFEALNLHPKRARTIEAYILGECGLIVECNVIAMISPESVAELAAGLPLGETAHTLFVGEVADVYRLR